MPEKVKILIIDDEKDALETLSDILQEKGYQTETAKTAKEALKKAEEQAFDIALLDIRLPDSTGIDVLRAFTENHPTMMNIMMTAYATVQSAVDAVNLGASAFIMKPINQEKLTQAIEESLQRQKIFANRSEMPASLRTPEIRIILKAIDKEKIMEFTPSFSYQKGVSYPELERILPPPKTNNGLLDELERFGAMKKEFYDSFTACPKCDSNRISLKFRCSSCNSTDIDRKTKIEHVPCGNVDVYEKFVKGKNLICPKCGKELKTLNVDYKEIEPHLECHNCKSSARPKHEYKCENCKESYTENQLYLKKMFKFTITPAQRTLIEKWVRDFDTLLESARELYRGTNEFYDPDAPKVSFSQMAKRG